MKIIAVNGSPRPNWNTGKLLQECLKGAEDNGAETEIINLYKLNYKGCRSCFMCKRRGDESCICRFKDELEPVLQKIHQCDAFVLGSPIYFGDITGQMQAFLERLSFPAFTYDDFSKSMFPGQINSAFIFTMGIKDPSVYQQLFNQKTFMLKNFNGKNSVLISYDAWQFEDYSKYQSGMMNVKEKKEHLENQFPKDLAKAYEIGKQLAKGQ